MTSTKEWTNFVFFEPTYRKFIFWDENELCETHIIMLTKYSYHFRYYRHIRETHRKYNSNLLYHRYAITKEAN